MAVGRLVAWPHSAAGLLAGSDVVAFARQAPALRGMVDTLLGTASDGSRRLVLLLSPGPPVAAAAVIQVARPVDPGPGPSLPPGSEAKFSRHGPRARPGGSSQLPPAPT